MFRTERNTSALASTFSLLELIYHATVRSIRKSQGNAILGLLQNMFQTIMLVATFYLMYSILGMRGSAVRGDFMLYIMSGIFLYMTYTKAMSAVFASEGSSSAMMKHGPMTTAIAISAAPDTAIPAAIPSQGFCKANATAAETKAEASILPSKARSTTPLRSANKPAIAAKIKTGALRMVATKIAEK